MKKRKFQKKLVGIVCCSMMIANMTAVGVYADEFVPETTVTVSEGEQPAEPAVTEPAPETPPVAPVETEPGSVQESDSIVQTESPLESTVETESALETETQTESVEELDTSEKKEVKFSYSPSAKFASLKDKTRFDVSQSISGIPSFITKDMLIGAIKCQDEYGFPASVTIAQIIQESGYGSYNGLSYLAYGYKNLFGIKGVGTAGTANMRTIDEVNGVQFSNVAGFRAYNTYSECIEDRAEILKKYYHVEGITDANSFAVSISSSWATGAPYAEALLRVMSTYDLYRLDSMTLFDVTDEGIYVNACPGAQVISKESVDVENRKFDYDIKLSSNDCLLRVYSATDGKVLSVKDDVIIIKDGRKTIKYIGASDIAVQKGDQVTKGQMIGNLGADGEGNELNIQVKSELNPVKQSEDPAVIL